MRRRSVTGNTTGGDLGVIDAACFGQQEFGDHIPAFFNDLAGWFSKLATKKFDTFLGNDGTVREDKSRPFDHLTRWGGERPVPAPRGSQRRLHPFPLSLFCYTGIITSSCCSPGTCESNGMTCCDPNVWSHKVLTASLRRWPRRSRPPGSRVRSYTTP